MKNLYYMPFLSTPMTGPGLSPNALTFSISIVIGLGLIVMMYELTVWSISTPFIAFSDPLKSPSHLQYLRIINFCF